MVNVVDLSGKPLMPTNTMLKSKLKTLFHISNLYNAVIFSSVFTLTYKIIISSTSDKLYMVINFVSLFLYALIGFLITKPKIRKYLTNRYMQIVSADIVLYSTVILYSIHNYELRFILTNIISATTTLVWSNYNSINQQLLWHGEELVNFNTKNNFIGSLGSLAGSLLGILISSYNISYEHLCYVQVVMLFFLGWMDLYILRKSYKLIKAGVQK